MTWKVLRDARRVAWGDEVAEAYQLTFCFSAPLGRDQYYCYTDIDLSTGSLVHILAFFHFFFNRTQNGCSNNHRRA